MDHLIGDLGGSASALGRQAIHRVRTNILPRVEQELRENIVPKLEQKGKELKERWNEEHHRQRAGVKRRRRRPRPPSNTDMVYLTERFLVSSKPASDTSNSSGPTFLDIGRDVSSREAREEAKKSRKRQQNSRHDRTFRQRGKLPRVRHSDSIQEDLESQEEQEHTTSSIPEEEGHDPPIEGESTSELGGNQEEAANSSANPQDCGSAPATPTEVKNAVPKEAEIANGEDGVVIIQNQEADTQSPARKPSISPPLTTGTNHTPDAESAIRKESHSSFHSNITELVENRQEITDTPDTMDLAAATPLTTNLHPRVITDLDEKIEPTGDGPPLIPSMPLATASANAISKVSVSNPENGSVTDGDSSVASFATCRMDDETDTFDATPEPQQDSRPEPAIKPPQQSYVSSPAPAPDSSINPQSTINSSISSSTPSPASIINSPGSMVTYLDKVHGRDRYLAVSLAKEKPDDRTLLLFRRQIVLMGLSKSKGNHSSSQWSPCCVERSETPSIPHMLNICYALHAFLHLDPNNVVLTYCDNGKTRTAIVAACYLRFSNMVEKTADGFQYFLMTLRRQRKILLEREKERRKTMGPLWTAAMDAMLEDHYDDEDCDLEANGENFVGTEKKMSDVIVENIMKQIPPSLKLFFEQFDRVLQLGGFLNRKPLLLRAIMLQGVPVEDQPCLDIWDSNQRHVYSSHPPMSMTTPRNNKKPVSQWVDEEGFYRINVVLDGEFLVLCRFGGNPAQLSKERNIHDPSKILFRYTNTTGFLSGGCPYELPAKKVDLMRLYADHLDDEEFLLTLLFEADWEHIEDDEYNVDTSVSAASRKRLGSVSEFCGERIWRSHEEEARDEGWRVIFEHHCARPAAADMDSFRRVHRHPSAHEKPDFRQCPDHLITLSLQLTNYDFQRAAALLLNSPVFSWWREDEELSLTPAGPPSMDVDSKRRENRLEIETHLNLRDATKKSFREIENEATQSILDILDSVDVSSNLDTRDQNYVRQWKPESRTKSSSFKEVQGHDGARSDNQASLSTLCLKETGYLIPSVIYPHRGDIVRSFHIHGTTASPEGRNDIDSPLQALGKRKRSVMKPRIPYFSNDKPKLLPPPSDHIQFAQNLFDSKNQEYRVPAYDSQLEAAKEIHSQLRHTGVTLDMLLELQRVSKQWTGFPDSDENSDSSENPGTSQEAAVEEIQNTLQQRAVSMNREEKEKKEKGWQDAQKVEAEEKGKAREQEKVTEQQKLEKATEQAKAEVVTEQKAEEPSPETDGEKEVLLKDDPDYGKYFKMLKLGMPREQVLHAFQRDGRDPKILDLDPNKSLESQLPSTDNEEEEEEVPLKDDPEYAKYFKMLKLGMPREQVLHAFHRDGKDPKILDLDPNKSLESQVPSATANADEEDELPLEDDPEYVKYFKMLKLGMPKEQVLHALKCDEKNPNILDLDPKKSLKSQEEKPKESGDGTPLKDDPEYSKYFKMIKMGMPKEQVLHALQRDGKDPKVLDLDPNKSLKSQEQSDDGVPLMDDPEYSKYFKMEKVGLPKDAVRNALIRDGKDPSIIDLDPSKSLNSQINGKLEEKDTGIPLKDDPDYAKYFKMEKMGMPKDAVKNALVRDGKNPDVIDLDPNMSVEFQLKRLKSTSPQKPVAKKKKKKKVRRKKIYWNPIDPKKIKEDSLWNIVRDHIAMGNLDYDKKEFEELFTQSAEASAKVEKKGPVQKEAKKAVQAIDPKRSMNGGIVLSRIKTERKQVAEFVDKMDHTKFDAIELKNLKEYLATSDERKALDAYMGSGANSEEKEEELFKDLSETEKYMVTLMKVPDAEAKLHTMEFRNGFKNRFADMTAAVRTLNSACEELRLSEKFRKLMAIILTIVNQINTGGEGNLAMGFTLDALLKLNEAKAFDKKTSVLHYVVKLVKKNDESLLYFENDLGHVIPAESVLLDGIIADIKTLQNELAEVIKIVTKDADRIEKSGDAPKLTLAELVEQKSIVQHIGEVPQQPKMSSQLTGRTPMERFSMNAKVACEQALESINNVQNKYILVLNYFGEDEKMPTGDFFGILRRFMTEWKKATKQVEKIERRKAKERKREARRAAKAKKKARGSKNSSGKKGDKEKASTEPIPTPGPPIGGIAALAAAAAMKNSKEQEAKDAPSKPPPGGIATLAAEAALKKTKEQEAEDVPSKPPLGGIATLAAQAALKKSTETETGSSSPGPPAGGIAALAAEAALKKTKEQEAEDVPSKPPLGGIATLAAQAALKKTKEQEGEDVPSKPPLGGIATLAAQAALKKLKETETGSSSPGPPAGGIAALAAEAALKKTKEQEGEDVTSKPPLGGIATLAAQAALKKTKEQEGEDVPSKPPLGGIATLAAEAALKKLKETETGSSSPGPPAGGIAALAAQDALQKSRETETGSSSPEPPAGGIAALAAQAALQKSNLVTNPPLGGGIAESNQEASTDGKTLSEVSVVGSAELAAEVTVEKSETKAAEAEKCEQSAAGEIADLATEAMVKEAEHQEEEGSCSDPPMQGTIETSKEQEQEDSHSEPPAVAVQGTIETSKEQEQEDSHSEPPAVAVQGTIETSKEQEQEDSHSEPPAVAVSSLDVQIGSEKTPERSPQNGVPLVPLVASSLAAQLALEKTPEKSPQFKTPEQSPVDRMSSLAAQVALERTPKQSPQASEPSVRRSSLAAQVVQEKTPEKSPQFRTPEQSPADGMSSLAAQVALERTPKQSPQASEPSVRRSSLAAQVAQEKTPKLSPQDRAPERSPTVRRSSLAAQVARETTPKQSPQEIASTRSPTVRRSSLAAQVARETTPKQSPQEIASTRSPTVRRSSLAAQVEREKTPKQSPQDTKRSPNGGLSSLAAQVAVEKSGEKAPKQSPTSRSSSLAAQVVLEKNPKRSPTEKIPKPLPTGGKSSLAAAQAQKSPKTPHRSPTGLRSSLSLALEKVKIPSPQRSPHRSPTGLMSSLAMALDKGKQQDASKRKGPSLGSFFERQSRKEVQSEILRQNYDDSSVAKMAENFQKEQMHGNAWNQDGGIADYIGWANQAIKASDTDSVRDFETARDIVYDDQSTIATGMDDSTHATNMDDSTYATNFDDGTIATNFDDDASIGTAMTPRNDLGYSGGGGDYYNSEQYDDYVGGADDPYSYTLATDGTQNPYGNAVIDVPSEFSHDQGITNGLSFGGEDGFDGPGEYGTNEMMSTGGGYGNGLGGFGQDAGLGGFGMGSPTLIHTPHNDFAANPSIPGPPLGGDSTNLNLPWGATPKNQPTRKDGDHIRPWRDGPNRAKRTKTTPETTSKPKEEGIVFRGWGEAPKTPEQPKRKNWFWN